LQTKHYNVLSAVPNSLLLLRNKSFMLGGDIPMNPSVARLAVKPREPVTIAPEITELDAKCIPQYVLSVVKTVKCRSSLEKASQYIVVSATTSLNWAVRNNLTQWDSKGGWNQTSPRRFRSRGTQRL
jgi:hypothetical protein